MKKIAIFGISLMSIGAMTSCEKSYTCTCVYPGSSIGTTETSYKTSKKSEAETKCAALNTTAQLSGGSCAL